MGQPSRCEFNDDCQALADCMVFIKPTHERGYWFMCKAHAEKVMP